MTTDFRPAVALDFLENLGVHGFQNGAAVSLDLLVAFLGLPGSVGLRWRPLGLPLPLLLRG